MKEINNMVTSVQKLGPTHVGRLVAFAYHGEARKGTVEKIAPNYFTIQENVPREGNRKYSSYRFDKLESTILVNV